MSHNLNATTTKIQSTYPPVAALTTIEAPHLVTPASLTLVLAYLQYYTPNRLANGRLLAPNHLRNLATWLEKPAPKLRSLRQHPILAVHLAFLFALDYLDGNGTQLIPQPTIAHWLHLPNNIALHTLHKQLTTTWEGTLTKLNLRQTITPDITHYLQQSFTQQRQTLDNQQPQPIQWQTTDENKWVITLPSTLPNWLQFDLRQIGEWSPNQPLVCTPYTVATAVLRGYSPQLIHWILETAVQEPLSSDKQSQLIQWSRRVHTYQVRQAHLLTVAQPNQATTLMRNKRLRQATIEQITPRHFIIQEDMIPQLARWLKEREYPLNHNINTSDTAQPITDPQWQWLCTRVFINLGKITPLPCPSPHAQLDTIAKQLTPTQLTNLEAIANTIHNNIQQAIKGKDAFFPTSQPTSELQLSTINQAIADESILDIYYQALVDHKPSWRTIQPIRIEQHGALYYLTAYCQRAEMNLTFRLDRIKDIKI